MQQQTLFDHAAAQYAKDAGIDQAEDGQEDVLGMLRAIALTQGMEKWPDSITVDDVKEEAEAWGIFPRSPMVYGALFRGGPWVRTGYKPTGSVKAHGRPVSMWQFVKPEPDQVQP